MAGSSSHRHPKKSPPPKMLQGPILPLPSFPDGKDTNHPPGLSVLGGNESRWPHGQVQISYHRMQAVGRRSMGHAKESRLIVPAIFEKPTAIFEGLRHDEDEDREGVGWRCNCGVPEQAFHPDGTSRTSCRIRCTWYSSTMKAWRTLGDGRRLIQTTSTYHRTTPNDSRRGCDEGHVQ